MTPAAFIDANGLKKVFVAKRWGLSNFQMVAVLYPDRYYARFTDEQIDAIAQDLNQPADYVRKYLGIAA